MNRGRKAEKEAISNQIAEEEYALERAKRDSFRARRYGVEVYRIISDNLYPLLFDVSFRFRAFAYFRVFFFSSSLTRDVLLLCLSVHVSGVYLHDSSVRCQQIVALRAPKRTADPPALKRARTAAPAAQPASITGAGREARKRGQELRVPRLIRWSNRCSSTTSTEAAVLDRRRRHRRQLSIKPTWRRLPLARLPAL